MTSQRRSSNQKTWVDWVTMGSSVAGLIATTTIAVLSYRIEAKAKLFESRGYLDVDYVGVDLLNFCPAEDSKKTVYNDPSVGSSEIEVSFSLDRGFVKNAVWREAATRVSQYCKEIGAFDDSDGSLYPDRIEQYRKKKVLGYSLVYMIVRSQQSLFSISPVFQSESIKAEPGRDIWDYARLRGKYEEIPLGPVRKGEPVMMPVAIIHAFKLDTPSVVIPRRVKWTSPVTNSETTLPVEFLVKGDYWKSKQQGVTVSGGDLTEM